MRLRSQLTFRFLFVVIITSFSLFPFNAKAQTDSQGGCLWEPQGYISPELLATMAYRDSFKKEGIPGYGILETEFSAGNITAKDIVEAAVKACVLSNKYGVAMHNDYIGEVKNQLQLMIQANNGR
jgi:hypothetical protein